MASIFLFCWLGMGWIEPNQTVLELDGFNTLPKNGKPEFYTMKWIDGTVLNKEETPLSIYVKDMGLQKVQLLVDVKKTPVLYVADICTPVCADGECRLMYLRLYWNLLGEYAGYDRVSDEPLTKHDHDEFLEIDYRKLHLLLQDTYSVLRGKEIEDLVERPKSAEAIGVDAIAGATIAEVKESVVEGALYSCYVAWQLVHGDMKEKIKQHTISLYNQNLGMQMLNSSEYDYQLFALQRFDQDQFLGNQKRIFEIIRSSIPLVRAYTIKNLPQNYWSGQHLQLRVWECFESIDINSKSLMLNHIDKASGRVLELLSGKLETMTKNQLKIYLQSLEKSESLNQRIMKNLEVFSTSDQVTYGYIVKKFLKNYRD